MAARPIVVRGWGLAGHLGLSSRAFLAAARAGQLAPRAPVGAVGSPLGAARSRWIDDATSPEERARQLARRALVQALPRGSTSAVVVLAVPGERGRPALVTAADHRFLRAITAPLGVSLDPASSLVRGGHAAFATAIEVALDHLAAGRDPVLVGAVDAPVDAATLRWLAAEGRVAGLDGVEGRIPGEAAAFVCLTRAAGGDAGARLVAAATQGPGPASPGALLARVARRLDPGPTLVLTDANGERRRVSDTARVLAGAGAVVADATPVDWVSHTGDTGTATGAVLAALALEAARAGLTPRRGVLVALASDDGTRGALAFRGGQAGGALALGRSPSPRRVGHGRRRAAGLDAVSLEASLRDLVDDVASLLVLPDEVASERLGHQLDLAVALGRTGPRTASIADVRAAVAARPPGSLPVERARAWLLAHLRAPSRPG